MTSHLDNIIEAIKVFSELCEDTTLTLNSFDKTNKELWFTEDCVAGLLKIQNIKSLSRRYNKLQSIIKNKGHNSQHAKSYRLHINKFFIQHKLYIVVDVIDKTIYLVHPESCLLFYYQQSIRIKQIRERMLEYENAIISGQSFTFQEAGDPAPSLQEIAKQSLLSSMVEKEEPEHCIFYVGHEYKQDFIEGSLDENIIGPGWYFKHPLTGSNIGPYSTEGFANNDLKRLINSL